MTKMLASVAIAAAALAAAPAAAQESAEPTSMVSYGDLNLSQEAGRITLGHRIRAAARSVCGVPRGPLVSEFAAVRTCRAQTIAVANAKVDQVLASRGSGPSITVAARR